MLKCGKEIEDLLKRRFCFWTAAILGFAALLIAAEFDPAVSHKAEVIRRFLRGQSTAAIARELNHSSNSKFAFRDAVGCCGLPRMPATGLASLHKVRLKGAFRP